MKTLMAFMKKEWMEQIRSSRLFILGLIFLAVGIMNPAFAKLTPWLMEMVAETMEESGLALLEGKYALAESEKKDDDWILKSCELKTL